MSFDKFKGIQKEKEIKESDTSNLEVLLALCDAFVQDYRNRVKYSFCVHSHEGDKLYQEIYARLKTQKFNEQDLQDLIFAKVNKEYDKKESEILGICTGALLHLLTERNRKKRSIFYINGHGDRFEHLFYFAKKIDALIIDSFAGDHICEYAGYLRGKAEAIILANCQGALIAGGVGTDNGLVNKLVLYNTTGISVAWAAKANQIIRGEKAREEYERICKEHSLKMLK